MADGTVARYGPVTRLRGRLPGTIDLPEEASPLPIPSRYWERLVIHLPQTEQPALREALQRLLATNRAWTNDAHFHNPWDNSMGIATPAPRKGRNKRWGMYTHGRRAWFTRHVALMQESDIEWDLYLKEFDLGQTLLKKSNTHPLQEVLPNNRLDEADAQSVPYGGCRSITIRRDHFERLVVLAQHTLVGRLRAGWRQLTGRHDLQRPRTVARKIAQKQLEALSDIHESLPADQIEHIPVRSPEAMFATEGDDRTT